MATLATSFVKELLRGVFVATARGTLNMRQSLRSRGREGGREEEGGRNKGEEGGGGGSRGGEGKWKRRKEGEERDGG